MDRTGWRKWTFSSGYTVRYGPFPYSIYWDVMARALQEHPDPDPPMRVIDTVTGPEEIEDLENPEYLAAKQTAEIERGRVLSQAALELCVELEDDPEPIIARLSAKYLKTLPPDDPMERKVWFLTKFAIRTKKDWGIVRQIQRYSQIEDEEVRDRVEFFRGDVEGAEDPGADAPGASA